MTGEVYGQATEDDDSLWGSIKDLFSTGSEYKEVTDENIQYRRRLLDYRVENFLDNHFHDYVRDFGILDETALELRNEKVAALEIRSKDIRAFIRDADEDLKDLETRVSALTKSKKK